MANLKQLLKRKRLTGKELGILEVSNMAITYKQMANGEPVQPLFEDNDFRKRLEQMNERDRADYNGYMAIHDFFAVYLNVSNSAKSNAQSSLKTFMNFLSDATSEEQLYTFVSSLPVIISEKEYEEALERGRTRLLTTEAGTPKTEPLAALVLRAMKFYYSLYEKTPRKANPLKKALKKYCLEPIESDLILSRYNEAANIGYSQLPDGRRSDQMTIEEWRSISNDFTDPYVSQIAEAILDTTNFEEASGESVLLHFFNNAIQNKAPTHIPTRHISTEPPTGIKKLSVFELDLFDKLYVDLADEEELQDFIAVFAEAVDAVLADLEQHRTKGLVISGADERRLAEIPLHEWSSLTVRLVDLYDFDLYGIRAEAADYRHIWNGNRRAIKNGIAIHTPSAINGKPYKERIQPAITTLNKFFNDSPHHRSAVEMILDERYQVENCLHFLIGYNKLVDMIADYYDISGLDAFKDQERLDDLLKHVDLYNGFAAALFGMISGNIYEDEDLKRKKQQVLIDYFKPIDPDKFAVSDEQLQQAHSYFDNYRGFFNRSLIHECLFDYDRSEESYGEES